MRRGNGFEEWYPASRRIDRTGTASRTSEVGGSTLPSHPAARGTKWRFWTPWLLVVSLLGVATQIQAQEETRTTDHIWCDFYNYIPLTEKLQYDGDAGFRHAFGEFNWVRPA